ncbi:MAG: TusE/DsrC/DsvC family sulfur relay protein [Thiotrichales bacterium]|nr:MAG: TusE/DsrC/DsvC family sulfur relay protein [Thiotrichales bacterium]
MTHVEKNIAYSPTGNNDSGDRAREIDGWNIEHARLKASENGIEISDDHIDVIQFLRDYYVQHGWPKRTHELSRLLDRSYRPKICRICRVGPK